MSTISFGIARKELNEIRDNVINKISDPNFRKTAKDEMTKYIDTELERIEHSADQVNEFEKIKKKLHDMSGPTANIQQADIKAVQHMVDIESGLHLNEVPTNILNVAKASVKKDVAQVLVDIKKNSSNPAQDIKDLKKNISRAVSVKIKEEVIKNTPVKRRNKTTRALKQAMTKIKKNDNLLLALRKKAEADRRKHRTMSKKINALHKKKSYKQKRSHKKKKKGKSRYSRRK